jgi:ferritin-like metal-binding protein YciE
LRRAIRAPSIISVSRPPLADAYGKTVAWNRFESSTSGSGNASGQRCSGTKTPAKGSFGTLQPEEDTLAKDKTLHDLFVDTLKDIYFAEKKILVALPKMAKAAQSEKLAKAFEKHRSETEQHVTRLEQVFESIDEKPKAKTCDAIMGILDEGKEIMSEYKNTAALDAGLLAAAQAVEHYEISRYGTLKTWANELGYGQASRLLNATLSDEKKTDAALSQLAESEVNIHAQMPEAA